MAKTETEEKSIVEFTPFGTKDKIQLSIEIVKRLVAVKTKTGKSCTDEDAFKFMLMCQARKLNPFEGDAFLIGYDSQTGPTFSLITAHQAFLKRAELHPEFDGMESGTIVKRGDDVIELVGDWHMPNDQILGGWATVFFKNRTHPMKKRVRLARFNKNYGIWRDDPAGMIVKCAEADALRSSFPTMLGGLYISEEMPAVVKAEEIARPTFQPPNNGEPVSTAEVVEPTRPTETDQPAEQKKKDVPAPSLKRKSQTRPSAPTEPALSAAHKRMTEMLAIGNCTPQDFVNVALTEGWIDAEQGKFELIPEERIAEMLREENWDVVMKALDEHAAKRPSKAAAANRSDQLL
jgi:phage recombination protein Bet